MVTWTDRSDLSGKPLTGKAAPMSDGRGLTEAQRTMILNGMRIVRSDHLTRMVEDWSGVRSPSRARRRRRQGHQQRIIYVQRDMPHGFVMYGTMFVGPATYDRLMREAAGRAALAERGGSE